MISFLYDPLISKTPSGFITLMLHAASVEVRFNVPFISVLTKSDLLADEEREKINAHIDNDESALCLIRAGKVLCGLDEPVFGDISQCNMSILEISHTLNLIKRLGTAMYGIE